MMKGRNPWKRITQVNELKSLIRRDQSLMIFNREKDIFN